MVRHGRDRVRSSSSRLDGQKSVTASLSFPLHICSCHSYLLCFYISTIRQVSLGPSNPPHPPPRPTMRPRPRSNPYTPSTAHAAPHPPSHSTTPHSISHTPAGHP